MSKTLTKVMNEAIARVHETETARAEIAIEKILRNLQIKAKRKIKLTSVDTFNHKPYGASVEIFWSVNEV